MIVPSAAANSSTSDKKQDVAGLMNIDDVVERERGINGRTLEHRPQASSLYVSNVP